MNAFPVRSAHPGPTIEAGVANASFVAQARFDGWIAFTSWPHADVEALLPAELELVPSVRTPGEHPVAFILGAPFRSRPPARSRPKTPSASS